MIDDRNEYEKTRACPKANHVSSDNRVSNDHRHAITASSHPHVYSLRLPQRVKSITTVTVSYISYTMKK